MSLKPDSVFIRAAVCVATTHTISDWLDQHSDSAVEAVLHRVTDAATYRMIHNRIWRGSGARNVRGVGNAFYGALQNMILRLPVEKRL